MKFFIQVEINHHWINRSSGTNERITRIRAKQYANNDKGKRYRVIDDNGSLVDLIYP